MFFDTFNSTGRGEQRARKLMSASASFTLAGIIAHLMSTAFALAYAARIVPRSARRVGWTKPHQGKQEMARRRRQIAAGTLRRANGLDPL